MAADLLVQAGVLERDHGLRREHFQGPDAARGEGAAGQAVLGIEHAEKLAAVEQRHAERRQRAVRDDERVGAIGLVSGRVVEHHAFARARDVVDEPLRPLARAGEGRRRPRQGWARSVGGCRSPRPG